MNIRDLVYLNALAEHQNFRKAAENSFVSQPTLSTQIKKLENELDIQLIERMPNKAMLTVAGKTVLKHSQVILREVNQIKQFAKRQKHPETGILKLGIFPTLAPYLLPHVIPNITSAYPRLQLFLFEKKTEEIIHDLEKGELDASILALPLNNQHNFNFVRLFKEPFVIAIPSKHRLAKQTSINGKRLNKEQLLLLEDGHCMRDQTLEYCHSVDANEYQEFRATSLETLRQMVAANIGITLLPILAVQPPVAKTSGIKIKPFEGQVPTREIALVWRKSSNLSSFLMDLSKQLTNFDHELLHKLPD